MSRARVWAAWALLVACLVGWPVSCQTFAKEEPPAVLSLSWLALIIESVNVVTTQQITKKQEEGGDGGDHS
jgi:hypothetical protein